MGSVKFNLTPDQRAEIDKPVNGSGGYQTLLRHLQKFINSKNNLTVDDQLLGQIVRMCAYGSGGFQGRLRAAFRTHIRDLVSW